jgi:hypothetical protein
MLATAGNGFGLVALSAMMSQQARADASRRVEGASSTPHFPPKAKNVIFLFMDGGVSHVDCSRNRRIPPPMAIGCG